MVVLFKAINIEHFGEHIFESAINWLPTGDTYLRVGVMADPLTVISLFFVGWTVLMIFIYSIGYHNFGKPKGDHDRQGLPPHGAKVKDEHGHEHTDMSVEPMFSRFFAFIGLFAFGMYTLVVSDNLLTLFVGWEIMGLCSYLLIGFWFQKPSAAAAAKKAFVVNRIGDFGLIMGIFLIWTTTLQFPGSATVFHPFQSLNFVDVLGNADLIQAVSLQHPGRIPLICFCLFLGAMGKSAQFPLQVWLPDAMEGPTPVSALIHAATMVTAGVYLVARCTPLFVMAPYAQMAVSGIGAATAAIAALTALTQTDLKRVLAYSTVSQLGFMSWHSDAAQQVLNW